jgi:hypothetical protein
MDLAPFAYGAAAGLIVGVLWGRFERPPEPRPRRGPWYWILAVIVYAVIDRVSDATRLVLPTQFWLTLILVAWLAKPLGEQLRERLG